MFEASFMAHAVGLVHVNFDLWQMLRFLLFQFLISMEWHTDIFQCSKTFRFDRMTWSFGTGATVVLSLWGLKVHCFDNVDISINQSAISCGQPWNVKLPIFRRCSTETWICTLSTNSYRNGSKHREQFHVFLAGQTEHIKETPCSDIAPPPFPPPPSPKAN